MLAIRELFAMDDLVPPSYVAWPFYWLTRAHSRYQDALSSALEGTGMDATSWRIIMILKEQEWMSVSEIAAQGNAKLSTVTKAIQRMEALHLVVLRGSPSDGRVTEVSLSEKGLEMGIVAGETARHVFNRAFAGMTPERLQVLRELLGEVAQNLR